ncbi:MAG: hypothetical protein BGO01_02685 [Armatimonadetes bacterium 55-13]|nr:hypothetical protein [Armatimonadota bacterium]ODU51950.1 MAG: hypothetical protein ABT09_03200 [bacterium SCN 57-13]OJU62160.1 MAG: hypothetical protein BGO01_02685 [Armatimonadetes bacterium 55-13]
MNLGLVDLQLPFGGVWGWLWGGWMLVHLWPLKGFYRYFLGFQEGKGPQGGEAMALFGLMYFLSLYFIAWVNGSYLSKLIGTWPGMGLMVGVCLGSSLLWFKSWGALGKDKTKKTAALIGTILAAVLYFGANFWALGRIRGLF